MRTRRQEGKVMTISNPLGGLQRHAAEPAIGPQLVLAGALAAVLTVAAVM